MRLRRLSLAIVIATAAPALAAADQPQSLGTFRDWSAYMSGSGDQKVCYALAQPKSSVPKKKRDKIYFLISDWPGRHPAARGEVEIVPGFKYKDGSDVTLKVGAQTYKLFTKNDGDDGSAWVQELSDEKPMVEALRSGSSATVTGISSRGSTIRDTYSLSGLADALDKAHDACGM
ncbi:MAG TPA: invasion associated locus B family protein [Rhizomicrobium sp.]|nr:invasion associated locus B family protein [Rhizomicrobium sp.]